MATLKERDIALVTKDSSGNTVIEYPLTRAGQVEDLATVITDAIKAQAPSPANMKGATASAAGTAGLVPAPAAGTQAKYLRGDGTWQTPPNTTYSNMKGATASVAGTAGLVPAPAAGAANRYLRSDGTWSVPPDTTYKAGTGLTLSGTTFSLDSSITGNAGTAAYKIPYATCTTAASTAAKVATITNGAPFALVAGAVCLIEFTNGASAVTTQATLNINSTGVKDIDKYVKRASRNFWYIGTPYGGMNLIIYTGSVYKILAGLSYYDDYSDYSDAG